MSTRLVRKGRRLAAAVEWDSKPLPLCRRERGLRPMGTVNYASSCSS
jgi:hypothetical protein